MQAIVQSLDALTRTFTKLTFSFNAGNRRTVLLSSEIDERSGHEPTAQGRIYRVSIGLLPGYQFETMLKHWDDNIEIEQEENLQ